MTSKERIAAALAICTDTKVFEMGQDHLKYAPELFTENFPGCRPVIIADCNTWEAAGKEVDAYFKAAGIEAPSFIINEKEFHAEWPYVEMVEKAISDAGAIAVAVGSGVINDLCKLASHHLGQKYMTIPTAASVDGYSSFGASISYQGLKQTFDCPAPLVILADTDVIANAPKEMTAAGYADLAAKIPAGAEWMIADLFGTEPIKPDAWHMLQDVLDDMLSDPEGVAAGEPKAIEALFEGLTLSGFAMQAARSSRPASCSDHLFSHILDMTHHRYKGKLQSHGFQVAIGTLTMCSMFDSFFKMDLSGLDVEKCVAAWPSLQEEQDRAHEVFKDFVSPELGFEMMTKKYNTAEEVRVQLTRVKEQWPEFKAKLQGQCYSFAKMQDLFKRADAPYEPEMIGIDKKALLDMMPIVQMMRARINLFDLAKRACFYDELIGSWATSEAFGSLE